ncbi:hypothetical protein V7332_29940, partial [Bacillus thuringiensis]|uniref:hypothetical protein n=1 Tax=Bacillus thuringiensis TaxID=1428 RepID=UPI00300348B2
SDKKIKARISTSPKSVQKGIHTWSNIFNYKMIKHLCIEVSEDYRCEVGRKLDLYKSLFD